MQRPTGTQGTEQRPATRLAFVLLLALSLLPFVNALSGGFVFDDHPLIEQPLSRPGGISPFQAITQPYWIVAPNARLWRPVASASFALDWQLGQGRPALFHLVNLLLHAGVTLLLYTCLRRIGGSPVIAIAAAALFAVHPLHTEAVTWIAGRAELLAAAFALTAIQLSLARRSWLVRLTPVAVFLAVASKESAAAAPLLLLWARWGITAQEKRPTWRVIWASFGAVLLYLVLRRAVLGVWAGPQTPSIDNPLTGMGLLERLPTVLDVVGRYLSLFFWPDRLSIDYSASTIPVVHSITPRGFLGAAVLVTLLALAIRGRRTLAGWGAGFALLTFTLTSNLPFVIGTIMAERLLYLPSAGLLLTLVATAASLATAPGATAPRDPASTARRRSAARVVLAGLLFAAIIACGVRTWHRNQDYRSDLALFSASVRTTPESPKVRTNLALWLYKTGRFEEAITQARTALRLQPNIRDARDIVASSLENLRRPNETIAFLKLELIHDPDDRFSREHLIELLHAAGRHAEADSILQVGRRLSNPSSRGH